MSYYMRNRSYSSEYRLAIGSASVRRDVSHLQPRIRSVYIGDHVARFRDGYCDYVDGMETLPERRCPRIHSGMGPSWSTKRHDS